MARKGTPKRKHTRTSVKGKKFKAGHGKSNTDLEIENRKIEKIMKSVEKSMKRMESREPLEGVRKHKLMPASLRKQIPKLYSQENESDPMVRAKFFSPYSRYTLYVLEFDGEDTIFGYVTGLAYDELGYSSFNELANLNRNGLPLIERDRYFTPKRLSKVKDDG